MQFAYAKNRSTDLIDLADLCLCLFAAKIYVIRQTCLCDVDPLTPHFYIVKPGFTGVFILIFALKHRLWVLIRTASLRRF